MSVNVETQNNTDCTVQVHIAFGEASRRTRPYSRRRRGYARNDAGLRNGQPRTLATGENRATHQSSTKRRRYRPKQVVSGQPKLKALPAPQPKSPA